MNNVYFRKFIKHLLQGWIQLNSLFLIRDVTELANSVTHCLCVISIVQSLHLVLADSFKWWFMICHLYFLFLFVVSRGIEPLLQEWKSCVLADRRRDHLLFCGCKGISFISIVQILSNIFFAPLHFLYLCAWEKFYDNKDKRNSTAKCSFWWIIANYWRTDGVVGACFFCCAHSQNIKRKSEEAIFPTHDLARLWIRFQAANQLATY